ncbi:MAG: hypothetical protein PSV16_11850 [Flavobacterium sp.]|nr:hypothetical protein [Flavobacterium sp.]
MKKLKMLISGTILSVLCFFSISFMTLLLQINPLHYYKNDETYKLDIGFPLVYYNQFFVDSGFPNSGWNLRNLFFDFMITWLLVMGLWYVFYKRKLN